MTIIGVAGGTASGKTTFVNKVLKRFDPESVGIISQDSYYRDNSHLSFDERCKINYDHPEAIDFDLFISQIKALKNGKTISRPIYDFKTHNRTNKTIQFSPKKVLIIEGILVLHDLDLRDLIDLKIFLDATEDQRLMRRIQRDIAERGRATSEVITRFKETLKPMHETFIEPSKAESDILIPANRQNQKAIELVQIFIQSHLILE